MILLIIIALQTKLISQTYSKIYTKCFPFNATSKVPISESSMDSRKVDKFNFTYEKMNFSKNKIMIIDNLFNGLNKTNPIEDYDIRALITFRTKNNANKTYYINQSKDIIIYNHNFYKLTKKEFKLISSLFDCRCNPMIGQ